MQGAERLVHSLRHARWRAFGEVIPLQLPTKIESPILLLGIGDVSVSAIFGLMSIGCVFTAVLFDISSPTELLLKTTMSEIFVIQGSKAPARGVLDPLFARRTFALCLFG